MTIFLRKSQDSDLLFLRKMLYQAVFWRAGENQPSFEEGLAYPGVSNSLADWGKRNGDTAVVAVKNSDRAGAAWYRYWTDDNFIRGYIEVSIPVLVIAVDQDSRRQGIGKRMMAWLIERASEQGVQKISLSVSKDNVALNLYKQQGFKIHSDIDSGYLMVRKITPFGVK